MKSEKPLIKLFYTNGNYYMYDVNKNSIMNIDESTYSKLESIRSGTLEIDECLNCFTETAFAKELYEKGYLSSNRILDVIHPSDELISYFLENKVKMLTLQVTQQCNFRCEYCIYSGNYMNRDHANKKMSFSIAAKGIDFLIDHSSCCKEIAIAFYGGEPLLEFNLIKQCIEYAEYKGEGKKISFHTTTNGSLLSEEIIGYFDKHNVSLTISLDGPKKVHDNRRKFVSNDSSTFDKVIDNIMNIEKKYPEYIKKVLFSAVIDPVCDFSCVDEFFINYETIKNSSIIASVVSDNYSNTEQKVNEDFLVDKEYELFKIFYSKTRNTDTFSCSKIVMNEYKSIEKMAQNLRPVKSLPEKFHHSGPCIPGAQRLFMDTEGNFYPCERVSETSDLMKIGHIDTGFNLEKAKKILNIGKINEESCKNCWAIRFCGICAATIDDTKEFSTELKNTRCKSVRLNAEENLKNYCTLKEYGHSFEEIEPLTVL